VTKAIARDPIYRGRRFQSEIIELCVRWYLTYGLSYRDLVAMMAERGVTLSHTTIFRWVQRYVPEFESRWSRYAKPVHSSWRMDETAISASLLLQGLGDKPASAPPKGESRWQRGKSSGLALVAAGTSRVAVRHRSKSPISQ
jgi:hypothetical protein